MLKIDAFVQIEKKYDLYHMEINGVQPWMYFRMKFWNYQICKDLLTLSKESPRNAGINQYLTQLKSLMRIIMRNNAKQICQSDIIFYSHPRRIKSNDHFECIYTDCLVKKYANSIVLEEPFKNRHFVPLQIEHIYYTDLLQIKSLFYYYLQRSLKSWQYKKIYTQVKNIFEIPLKELRQTYQFKMSDNAVFEELVRLTFEIHMLKRDLRKILEKVQPKLLVEAVYYNKRCMALNELAKEMQIPTVELQHGTMHAAHAAYQFAPESGEIRQFPEYVFLFSEYWKQYANLPLPEHQIKVTGYPYFESQLRKYTSNIINKEEKKNIIFISQETIGQKLGQLATELNDLLDQTKYHIIYKLHPGEYSGWKNRYPELVQKNIEVIDSFEHNVYEYFSKCKIQVGVYSTAIYEGLGFGLTTYIYDVGHADTMAELCDQGYAVCIKNANELFENITNAEEQHSHNTKSFWEKNALENICQEIDQLLLTTICGV